MREAKKLDEMTEISNEMESWKVKELQQDKDVDDEQERETSDQHHVDQTERSQDDTGKLNFRVLISK